MDFTETYIDIGTSPIKIHLQSNLPDGATDMIVTRELFYEPLDIEQ
jgi:hypothetical protein